MHYVFEAARELLTFLLDHRGVVMPALTAGTLGVLALLWKRLSLPNVRYVLKQSDRKPPDNDRLEARWSSITVLVRNMDSIPVAGVLIVEVVLKHPKIHFVRARQAAGPWIHTPHWVSRPAPEEGLPSTILLRCNGLPPDGAIQFELETNELLPQDGPRNLIRAWRDPRSTMKVRAFTALPKFSLVSSVMYFLLRLAFGLLLYVFVVSQWLGYDYMGESQVGPIDTAIFLGGIILVVVAWAAIMQFRGKDTTCGYELSPWEELSNVPAVALPPAGPDNDRV